MAYRTRMVLAAATAVAAIGLAVGCGAASDNTPTAQTGFAAYSACLAQNGVTLAQNTARPSGSAFPRPSGSAFPRPSGFGDQAPSGVDQATWEKAQQACASLRPTGGPGGFNGGGNNSAFAAYRNCLTEHGVTASTGVNELNTADPTVAAAVKACEALRPTGAPRPAPTPT